MPGGPQESRKQVANLKWEEFVRSWFTSGDNHTPCVISDWHGKDRHCLFLLKFFTALLLAMPKVESDSVGRKRNVQGPLRFVRYATHILYLKFPAGTSQESPCTGHQEGSVGYKWTIYK